MGIKQLVKKSRSFRRFDQSFKISRKTLNSLIGLARFCPSARNQQALKFLISCESGKNGLIFSTLTWAAALKDWPGPAIGERPAAYIVVLGDTCVSQDFAMDAGIVSQTIMLGAREKELGGCMIANINRQKLTEILGIPPEFSIILVLAIGKPKENVKIVPVNKDAGTNYFRDKKGTHFVPKRKLEDIIIG